MNRHSLVNQLSKGLLIMSNATDDPKSTKTRRGLALYDKNPYLISTSQNTNEGTKKRTLKSKDGSQMMVTSQSGEVIAPAGFWQTQEVDKTQFVKLYINGVRAFRDLSPAGTKVFEVLYLELQKTVGKDRVYLSFSNIDEHLKISQATFTRGMRELLDKKFLAPTLAVGWYWINPDYLWNGDRLAFVKEYRLKRDVVSDKTFLQQREMQERTAIDQNSETMGIGTLQ